MMRDLASFVIFLAMMVGTAVSKPLWSTIIDNHDVYSTPEINAQYLAAYQHTRSPYYVYNIYTNAGGIPSTVHVGGKPEISYVPSYNFYYGTPIYDLRIPLNPIYPMLTPSHPGVLPPALPPTSTQQPSDDDDYDGIEKLDTKVDTVDTETKKPGNDEQDDDSITVEAI
ncbi:uncharacterized protein LOC115242677 isoform X2 [Formica exsecta]|uniref:uncharacterized protein LOC115242677 isoform X2 n=1 Tax=Formica exsecta TaxID=72781 RepID=UPI0011435823|nr:uncharacterized protein LOC115242677 isoform X2 [Formica exsecta]